jgi:MerR family copper efflux transcriptional regulator
MDAKKLNGLLRIGALASASGISTDTLRHYEKKGLLRPKRSTNGYREYSEDALERVRMIQQALAVGFTLDELTAVFKVFDHGGAPCDNVRALAATKLVDIERHLQDVTAMRDVLRDALAEFDTRLAATARGKRAHLLKALAARKDVKRSSTSLLLRKP